MVFLGRYRKPAMVSAEEPMRVSIGRKEPEKEMNYKSQQERKRWSPRAVPDSGPVQASKGKE